MATSGAAARYRACCVLFGAAVALLGAAWLMRNHDAAYPDTFSYTLATLVVAEGLLWMVAGGGGLLRWHTLLRQTLVAVGAFGIFLGGWFYIVDALTTPQREQDSDDGMLIQIGLVFAGIGALTAWSGWRLHRRHGPCD